MAKDLAQSLSNQYSARSHWRSRIASGLAALLLATLGLALPAGAQTEEPLQSQGSQDSQAGDTLFVEQLTGAPSPVDGSRIRFEALLNYRLTSGQGSLAMYLFENDDERSTTRTPTPIKIAGGDGRGTLWLDYTPRPTAHTLTVMVGLFDADDSLLAWSASNPFSLRPWPGREVFEQAMTARIGQDYDTALILLDEAIALSPDTAPYYYWRADTLARLSRHAEAVETFDQQLLLVPGDRIALIGKGASLLWLGQVEDAIAQLSTAIDSDTSADRWTAWAHRARGIAYQALDQREAAIADYQAYLTLSPQASDRAEVEARIAALQA